MRPDHARAIRERLADPARLAELLGLEVGRQRQAHGVIVRCPWHDDDHPSCSVRVAADDTVAAHCHACGASGDALSLVAVARGLDIRHDFRRVLAEAASLCGYNLTDADRPAPRLRIRPPPIDIALRIDTAASDWLAGRRVRIDPVVEGASWEQIRDAMADLGDALEIGRARDMASDDDLDAVLDAHEAEWLAREAAHIAALEAP